MDKYEIAKEIGEGKFGQVYLGRFKETKEKVAIKVISKSQIEKSEPKTEIKILKLVNHNNIIRYVDNFDDEDRIFIITNYISGDNLYNILKKHKVLEQKMVSKYVLQLIYAVKYLHGLNIIHRDIKPENIILGENNIILCDFGWSAISDSIDTKYTDLYGTLDYICPEMVRYEEYDYRCDIWCIGVLTYELLVGKVPFYSISYKGTYNNISKLKYTIPSDISDGVRDFISKILTYQNDRISIDGMLNHPFLS